MYIGFRGREKGFSGWKFGAGEAGAQDVEVTGNWFGTEMCTFGTVTYWSSRNISKSSLKQSLWEVWMEIRLEGDNYLLALASWMQSFGLP